MPPDGAHYAQFLLTCMLEKQRKENFRSGRRLLAVHDDIEDGHEAEIGGLLVVGVVDLLQSAVRHRVFQRHVDHSRGKAGENPLLEMDRGVRSGGLQVRNRNRFLRNANRPPEIGAQRDRRIQTVPVIHRDATRQDRPCDQGQRRRQLIRHTPSP